jgi:hypothetical protein
MGLVSVLKNGYATVFAALSSIALSACWRARFAVSDAIFEPIEATLPGAMLEFG